MYSDTYGKVTIEEMSDIIRNFMNKDFESSYNISIGTDSQNHSEYDKATKQKNLITKIVVVLVVHRIGKGAIFFYDTKNIKGIKDVAEKIYAETKMSVRLASKLTKNFAKCGINHDIEIHVDIGNSKNGKTFQFISWITGWVNSEGYKCKIKPESYAASSVADKISK